MGKRKRSDLGLIIFVTGLFIVMWILNGINMSLNDYRLFSLFFDLLVGFWIFVGVVGACILFLLIGIKKYWHRDLNGKFISFLYGSISIPLLLLTFIVAIRLALPAYVIKVRTSPNQITGVIEHLETSTISRGGWTFYHMEVDGRDYQTSRPWYKQLDVGQDLVFIAFGQRAFPQGFVNFTLVGMMATCVVLIGWFFTLYLIVKGSVLAFNTSYDNRLLEFFDRIP